MFHHLHSSFLFLLIISSLCYCSCDFLSYSLDGSSWSVQNGNKSISAPAIVPGNVFLDLLRAGIINDTLFRDNEQAQHWIAYDSWSYSTQFQLTPQFFAPSKTIEIIFDGIDTIASVYLNGIFLFDASNQHVRYSFDITSFLLPSASNTLLITFSSAVLYGQQRLTITPYALPVDDADLGLPYRNSVRKGQSDFGWDWGLATAGCGLYRSVSIVSYDSVRISELTIDNYFLSPLPKYSPFTEYSSDIIIPLSSPSPVGVDIRVYLQKAARSAVKTQVEMQIANTSCAATQDVEDAGQEAKEIVVDFHCVLQSPLLWWPHTYSSQHSLYTVSVSLSQSSSTAQKNFGVRSIELVRDPLPDGTTGETFYFRINGVPLYMKGSNLIPLDAFPTRASTSDMQQLLGSAIAAHQNVVRVWGGGLYQTDEFYDYADANGLMVWQEFGFACSIYARDDEFLANVRREVQYQTRRLASHPSILVFGGNNENEGALTWFTETVLNRDLYLTDYVKLYMDTVRSTFLRSANLSNIPFLTSSPSNGPIVDDPHSDYYVQRWGDVSDERFGDVHFYDYDDDCSSPYIYPRAKFISEFGFQSQPSFITYENVTAPEDWSWDSTIMQYRQRHDSGNNELKAMLERFFVFPSSSSSDVHAFQSYLYLTQVVQAICYSTALSHWRRIKQEASAFTQGILYWQLNDVWQAPTWSSIEYGGRWKLLHYQVKTLFHPILVSAYLEQDQDGLQAYFTSDSLKVVKGQVFVNVIGWDSKVYGQVPLDIAAAPLSSQKIFSTSLSALMSSFSCSSSNCFILFSAELFDSSGAAIDTPNWPFFPIPLKNVALPAPRFAISIFAVNGMTAVVSIVSSVVSPWTWLETELAGVWGWNGELLLANESRNVTFKAEQSFTPQQLLQSITIRSIADTYQ